MTADFPPRIGLPFGRALGIDMGSRRIGVAISDADGTLATPLEVIQRTSDLAAHRRAIASLVEQWEISVVVVGSPLSLDGSTSTASAAYGEEACALATALDIPVVLHDERLTTVTASRMLADAGVRGRKAKARIDAAAAAVMLQSWLDGAARKTAAGDQH